MATAGASMMPGHGETKSTMWRISPGWAELASKSGVTAVTTCNPRKMNHQVQQAMQAVTQSNCPSPRRNFRNANHARINASAQVTPAKMRKPRKPESAVPGTSSNPSLGRTCSCVVGKNPPHTAPAMPKSTMVMTKNNAPSAIAWGSARRRLLEVFPFEGMTM